MIAFKIIVLLCLLNVGLSKPDTDRANDTIGGSSDEKDVDTFLIAGGVPIKDSIEKFEKSVVSITTSRPTLYFGDNHFCAGTLIGSSLVVTAAHCVTDQNKIQTRAKRLLVVGGSTLRLKRLRTTKEFRVTEIYVHKQYLRHKRSDIALLRLSEIVSISNDKIKIASMMNTDVAPGTNCSIMGWGQLFHNGPYVNKLLYSSVMIMPQSVCMDYYPKGFGKDLLCAISYENRGSSTCRGDTGGPLFCADSKGIQQLAGIVAWSYECTTSKPSLFTSIKYHFSWIRQANSSSRNRVSIFILQIALLVYYAMGS